MTTEELYANLEKVYDIVDAASNKLFDVSIILPDDSEINAVRLPVAVATVHDVSETLLVIRHYSSMDDNGEERQLSGEELKKICAIICKHLWLVRDLIEDIQRELAVDDNEYGTDLWVLSTAIAEMIGKFSQKDDNEGQTV